MRNERRVLRNAAILTGGEVLGQLANLLFVVAFARHYGAAVLGHYSLGMAIGAVAGLGVSLGTQAYLLREIARSPQVAASYVAALAPWQALAVVVIGGLAALALSADPAGAGVMLAAIAYQLVHRASGLYFVAYRATERMSLVVLADFAQRAGTLLVGVALMAAGADAAITASAMLVSAAALAVTGRLLMRRDFGPLPAAPAGTALGIIRASWAFFGTLALTVLSARGAPILLGLLRDAEAVGRYAVADRLIIVATLLPVMFCSAAVPALSRIMHEDPQEAGRLATRLLRLLQVLALPLAAGLAAFAGDIVLLVFGAGYAESVPLLQILALSMPLQCAEQLIGAQLSAASLQHLLFRTRLLALGCFVVVGSVLVMASGASGLAWTVVICSAVQLAGAGLLLSRRAPLPLRFGTLAAPAAAALAAAVAAVWLGDAHLVLRAAAFVATFGAVGWLLGAVQPHDVSFALTLLRRPRG